MRATCPAGIHPAPPVTHRWRSVLAAGVLLSALPLHAAADDCDASSRADRLDCLQRVAEASARELLDAASALATAIDRWNEDAMHRDRARQRLPTDNTAFAGYRAAHGALDRSLGGGTIGTGLAMRQHHCIAELNTRHATQLRRLAATLPATPP